MYVYYNTVATRNAECCSNDEEGEKKDKGAKTEALRLFQEEKKKKDRDVLWVNRRNELRRKESVKASFLNTLKFAAEQLERSKSEKEKDKESVCYVQVSLKLQRGRCCLCMICACGSICHLGAFPLFLLFFFFFFFTRRTKPLEIGSKREEPERTTQKKKKEERKKKKLAKGKKEREKERERHRGLFRCYPVLSCLVLLSDVPRLRRERENKNRSMLNEQRPSRVK